MLDRVKLPHQLNATSLCNTCPSIATLEYFGEDLSLDRKQALGQVSVGLDRLIQITGQKFFVTSHQFYAALSKFQSTKDCILKANG